MAEVTLLLRQGPQFLVLLLMDSRFDERTFDEIKSKGAQRVQMPHELASTMMYDLGAGYKNRVLKFLMHWEIPLKMGITHWIINN